MSSRRSGIVWVGSVVFLYGGNHANGIFFWGGRGGRVFYNNPNVWHGEMIGALNFAAAYNGYCERAFLQVIVLTLVSHLVFFDFVLGFRVEDLLHVVGKYLSGIGWR